MAFAISVELHDFEVCFSFGNILYLNDFLLFVMISGVVYVCIVDSHLHCIFNVSEEKSS